MYGVPVKTLLESGVHFGHRASRWNPRMEPFIFGKRNLIHIIDLKETLRGLLKACTFLQSLTSRGSTVLFVGTKRQAQNLIATEAEKVSMPYVAERWLGGTLTNFETIRSRLHRLEQLESMQTDGTFKGLSKKQIARFDRERSKIFRNLNGIRNMVALPGAVVVVDPRNEKTAIQEAHKLGIPTIAILDTDCDPSLVDIPIPGNDDALRSIQVLISKLTEAIANGQQSHQQFMAEEAKRRTEEAERQAEERAKKVDEQKKRDSEQADLENVLKKAREDRASRKSESDAGDKPESKAEAKPAKKKKSTSTAKSEPTAEARGDSAADTGKKSAADAKDEAPPAPEAESGEKEGDKPDEKTDAPSDGQDAASAEPGTDAEGDDSDTKPGPFGPESSDS